MSADLNRLRGVPAFASLDSDTLGRIASLATERRIAAGDTVFTEGMAALNVHFLHEGRLKILRESRQRHPIIVRIAHPGDMFGLASLLGRSSHTVSAVALSEVRCATWPADLWRTFLLERPSFSLELMRIAGERLNEAHERMIDIATLDVPDRVLHALLDLVDQAGATEAAGTRIAFPLTRQDLAAMTGTTLHNVSRILRGWERQGLIEGGRRTLLVRDLPALVQLAAEMDR